MPTLDLTKTYRTSTGHPVTVLSLNFRPSKASSLKAAVLVHHEDHDDLITTELDGKPLYYNFTLVEVGPYDHIKIDDLVMVRDSPSDRWLPRHFAGIRDGKPTAWNEGSTSWYCMDMANLQDPFKAFQRFSWKELRLPTAAELADHQAALKTLERS